MSSQKNLTPQYINQLRDSIPGAFQVAARSLRMTVREFDSQMEMIKLTEFLPKFKAQLQKECGGEFMDEFKLISGNEIASFIEEPEQYLDGL